MYLGPGFTSATLILSNIILSLSFCEEEPLVSPPDKQVAWQEPSICHHRTIRISIMIFPHHSVFF